MAGKPDNNNNDSGEDSSNDLNDLFIFNSSRCTYKIISIQKTIIMNKMIIK